MTSATTTGEEEMAVPTAIVVVGEGMFFQPSGDHIVACVTAFTSEAFATALNQSDGTYLNVDHLHVVTNTRALDTDVFTSQALEQVVPHVKEGGQVVLHVVPNQQQETIPEDGEDTTTNMLDQDIANILRTSLVLAGLQIHGTVMSDGQGATLLAGIKPPTTTSSS